MVLGKSQRSLRNTAYFLLLSGIAMGAWGMFNTYDARFWELSMFTILMATILVVMGVFQLRNALKTEKTNEPV